MLNPYKFHYRNFKDQSVPPPYRQYAYVFYGASNKKYIVNIETYEHNVYVIKFYLAQHKQSKDKYNIRTFENDILRVLWTCYAILMEVIENNETANFGFKGAPTIAEEFIEEDDCTQRHKIYKWFSQRIIEADPRFDVYFDDPNSSCLFINKNNTDPDIVNKITRMFATVYPLIISADE